MTPRVSRVRRGAAALLAAVALALTACASSPSRVAVSTDLTVHVRIAPPPDALPFDPRAARLRAATDQLAALVRHPVDVEIDAALAAEHRADFERQLIVAVESMVRALTELRDEDADAFARVVPELRLVRCRYRILVDQARASMADGIVDVEEPAHAPELLDADGLRAALDARADALLDAPWDSRAVDSIARGEIDAYFKWLTRHRPHGGSLWERRHRIPDGVDPLTELESDPHAEVLARVLALHAKAAPESASRAALRAWLFEQIGWFWAEYEYHRELTERAAASSSFRRAEERMSAFLARALPSATDQERMFAARALFPAHAPRAFPGVDRFAFGLSAADAWLAAGKPPEGGVSQRVAWVDPVVCPSTRDADGGRSRRSECDAGWLHASLDAPEWRARLASALDARDPELTTTLFVALRFEPIEPTLALFRELDPKRPAQRAAWMVLAEVLLERNESAIVREADARWTSDPSTRGLSLYVIARASGRERIFADSTFRHFAEDHGGPIGARELAQFVAIGPPTLPLLPPMWPALAKDARLGQTLARELRTLLPDAASASAGDALRALSELVSMMCRDGAGEDLAALHAALATRIAAAPAQRLALATLLGDTAPGRCVARKKHRAP
jgi:hypothetical protein